MIILTRLNGPSFALNPDLIERADCTPDTVITLVDGTKYVVSDSIAEIITKVRWLRASILATAAQYDLADLEALEPPEHTSLAAPHAAPHPATRGPSPAGGPPRVEVVPFKRGQ